MRAGYYFANTLRYGKHWRLVKGFTSLYLDWEDGGLPVPKLPGKRMWVDLGLYGSEESTYEAVRTRLRKLRRYWGKVIALELGDEFHGTRAEFRQRIDMVRRAIRAEGLPARPLGFTQTGDQIMRTTHWAQADWVGLEAYIEYRPGESPDVAKRRMTQHLAKLILRADEVNPSLKYWLVCQGYDRNFTWKSIPSLVAVQSPAFDLAKRLAARCIGVGIFAFSRPGGSKDHPELKAEHRRLLA